MKDILFLLSKVILFLRNETSFFDDLMKDSQDQAASMRLLKRLMHSMEGPRLAATSRMTVQGSLGSSVLLRET